LVTVAAESAERLSRRPDRSARPRDHRLRAALTCSLGEELGAGAGADSSGRCAASASA
jgi:hypothetical protein